MLQVTEHWQPWLRHGRPISIRMHIPPQVIRKSRTCVANEPAERPNTAISPRAMLCECTSQPRAPSPRYFEQAKKKIGSHVPDSKSSAWPRMETRKAETITVFYGSWTLCNTQSCKSARPGETQANLNVTRFFLCLRVCEDQVDRSVQRQRAVA